MSWGVFGVVLGGRIGYCLFYKPAYYAEHPLEVLYHESWGGSSLSLAYEGPDLPAQDIPATAYFHRLD